MGFFVRFAAWTLGVVAVLIAGAVVYNTFFGGPDERQQTATPRACPPPVSLPARAPGAPADDVVGLRPGFTIADARAMLMCRDEKFAIAFEPIWHTAVPTSVSSRQSMVAVRPKERIALGLVGAPEHEIVHALFQEIQYGDAEATMTPAAAEAALISRYGLLSDKHADSARIELWWLRGADGKPIRAGAPAGVDPFTAFAGWVTGSLAAANCERNISLSPVEPARWSDQCGLTIHAEIELPPVDKTRISRYRIVLDDQARLGAAVTAYRQRMGVAAP